MIGEQAFSAQGYMFGLKCYNKEHRLQKNSSSHKKDKNRHFHTVLHRAHCSTFWKLEQW